jgi:hypothetical protein
MMLRHGAGGDPPPHFAEAQAQAQAIIVRRIGVFKLPSSLQRLTIF